MLIISASPKFWNSSTLRFSISPMLALQFWRSWNKSHQIIFWILALAVSSALIFFWLSWLSSPAPVITLDHFQQIQRIDTPSHTFHVGLMNLAVPAGSYLIFENVFGSRLQPNVLASYFFVGGLALSFLFFISIIPALTRYWFLIGMGLIMLFLASLRFESLAVFGFTNKIPTVAMVFLFGGPAFYFH